MSGRAAHYADRLGSHLRGPRRLRADFVEEVRGGFDDAVADGLDSGLSVAAATAAAEDLLGPPSQVASGLQAVLDTAQARRTAVSFAVLPVLVLLWDAALPPGDAEPLTFLLARVVDAATITAVVVGAVVATRRTVRRPTSLVRVAAITGMAVVTTITTAVVTLAVVGRAEPAITSPPLPALIALSTAGMVVVATSSLNALRLTATRMPWPEGA